MTRRASGAVKTRSALPAFRAAALSLFALSVLSFPAFSADWPMFRGNGQRTGYAGEQAYPPLTKAWEFQVGGEVMSSPAIAGGIVYAGSRNGTLYALTASSGGLVWQYRTGNWIGASPTVSGGAVYVPSMDGRLYALDALKGTLLWRASLGSSSVSSPLVLGGRVFVGAGMPGKKILAFDAATGAKICEYPVNQPVDGAPAAYGSAVYLGGNDGGIYSLGSGTCLSLWSGLPAGDHYPTIGSFGVNAVAVSSAAVYALPGRDDKQVSMLNALTGAALQVPIDPDEKSMDTWERVSSPVLAPDRLYFAAGSNHCHVDWSCHAPFDLYGLDRQDLGAGSPAWPGPVSLGELSGFGMLSSPAMANEIIYAATTDGRLVAVSSSGVSAAADIDISSPAYSSPGVSNGMVFVATSGGKLLAYKAARIASISSPAREAVVNGAVTVKGYFANPDLAGYVLDYSPEVDPSSWTVIASSVTSQAVEDGALAEWDTASVANGLYTLRLTVTENTPAGTDNTAKLLVRVNADPLPPADVAAADVPDDGGNSIRITWTASPSPGIASYNIYRDSVVGFRVVGSTGAAAGNYVDGTAVNGTTFTYIVKSYDGWLESDDSNSASAFAVNDSGDNTPPDRITDLRAETPVPGTVILYWTAPGDDDGLGEASHYLIRFTSAAGYDWNDFDGAGLHASTRPVDGPVGSPEAQEFHGLFGGVTYYFAMKAADSVPNISTISNVAEACVTIDTIPPRAPYALSAADTPDDGGGSVTLNWTLSPDDVVRAGIPDAVYGYRIYRRAQGGVYVPGAPYAEVPRGVTAYADEDATLNTRFYYSVAAFDSYNNSALSNEVWAVSADNWRFFDATQGGVFRLSDGMEVVIPGSAASQNDGVMVVPLTVAESRVLAKAKASTQANPTGITYSVRFRSRATRLVRPARVTIPYTDAAVAGMDQENLRMYAMSGGAWTLLNTSSVDAGLKKVSADVMAFSTFTVMEYVPSGTALGDESVYSYPNPARGDTVAFKVYLPEKAYVKIDVYNVAGEKVARLERANCPAGIVSELLWSVKNVASGVYQYRVEAAGASGRKFLIKRLAVIH